MSGDIEVDISISSKLIAWNPTTILSPFSRPSADNLISILTVFKRQRLQLIKSAVIATSGHSHPKARMIMIAAVVLSKLRFHEYILRRQRKLLHPQSQLLQCPSPAAAQVMLYPLRLHVVQPAKSSQLTNLRTVTLVACVQRGQCRQLKDNVAG
jgi:hypothetical protein